MRNVHKNSAQLDGQVEKKEEKRQEFNFLTKDERTKILFEYGATTIYEKLKQLGLSKIYYTTKEFFSESEKSYVAKLEKFKDYLDKLCKNMLDDFNNLKTDKRNKIFGDDFTISINFKVKTKKQAKVDSEWVDGYTMGAAFRTTDESVDDTERRVGYYIGNNVVASNVKNIFKCDCAQTKLQTRDGKSDRFLVGNDYEKCQEPHCGISFSERFIEQFECSNLVETIKGCESDEIAVYQMGEKFYKVANSIDKENMFKPEYCQQEDVCEPYFWFETDKNKLAQLFNNKKRDYPVQGNYGQQRNQVLIVPVECGAKRIGYIQLTGYYVDDKESKIATNNKLSNKSAIVQLLLFYSAQVLYLDKIFNLDNTVFTQLNTPFKLYKITLDPINQEDE